MTIVEMATVIGGGCGAIGGLGWLASLTWHGGRQSQKLDNVIATVADLQKTQTEHARSISTLDQFVALLTEVRNDVKEMMKNRGNSRRRPGEAD